MRTFLATTALSASVAAGPALAQSITDQGFYAGVQGSFVLPSDQDFNTGLG